MSDYDSTDALVSIDFSARFPHKFWVSSWSRDEQYPNGFRYKLLSVRPEPSGPIELVIVIEEVGGAKTEMSRLEVSPSAFDRTASTFVEGFTESYGIEFTELDLSNVRTAREFERLVSLSGWSKTTLQ
jgi:hypothetical protein